MAELCAIGASIEGEWVDGQSRKPLRDHGLHLRANGTRCSRFIASFDVRAAVVQPPADQRLCPSASVALDAKLICAQAIIESLDHRPTSTVEKGSASHRTNKWAFRKLTHALIERPHEEILAGIAKRERK